MKSERAESPDFADAVLRASSDVLAVIDSQGTLTFASPAAQRMLGYEANTLIGADAFALVHRDDQLGVLEGFASTTSSADSRPTPLLVRLRRADGSWIDTEIIATNHLDDPIICGLVLTIRDVSESMRTEPALRESEERYRLIVELAHEGIGVMDRNATITYANRALATMFGTTVTDLIGRSFYEFMSADARTSAIQFARTRSTTIAPRDFPFHTKDGRKIWTRLSTTTLALHDGTYNGAVVLVTDITERRALEQQLARDAQYDVLTGLANRRTLFSVLSSRVTEPPGRCAVIFADLDKFKEVNDTYGHQAGDEVLRAVPRRIAATARKGDVVARVGGDEFVVVSADLPSEREALAIGTRLSQALSEPIEACGIRIGVTLSVGIAFSDPDDDADSLLARADHALYRAKRAGRDRIEVAEL